MLCSSFDHLLPESLREEHKPDGGLLPPHLVSRIDEVNEWIYDDLNMGVYKCGFASTQTMYEENVDKVFAALDRVEKTLKENGGPYLLGTHLTEADVKLYVTIVRFDVGYFGLFQCNLEMVRDAYPAIQKWLVELYWDQEEPREAFGRKTTDFNHASLVLFHLYLLIFFGFFFHSGCLLHGEPP